VNPYKAAIGEARSIMQWLISLMSQVNDMKLFKNIAAVYVVWQHEIHNLENAALEWECRK
jgi:hypothetical protein